MNPPDQPAGIIGQTCGLPLHDLVHRTPTIAPTPRTDAAYFATGATMYSLAGEMKLIERELTETERLRFGADADRRRLRCELTAAKAECERLKAADCIQCDGKGWYADGDPERPYQQQCQACNGTGMHETYRGELTRLRDEVEAFKNNNRYHRGHSSGYAEAKDDCDA
jgi:hypothetical protein